MCFGSIPRLVRFLDSDCCYSIQRPSCGVDADFNLFSFSITAALPLLPSLINLTLLLSNHSIVCSTPHISFLSCFFFCLPSSFSHECKQPHQSWRRNVCGPSTVPKTRRLYTLIALLPKAAHSAYLARNRNRCSQHLWRIPKALSLSTGGEAGAGNQASSN